MELKSYQSLHSRRPDHRLLIVLNGIEISESSQQATFQQLLIVLNGIEIHEAGLHQRGAGGLLIVLNGIEIGGRNDNGQHIPLLIVLNGIEITKYFL